jgi:two-component system, OmpR family, sensor histidine kinase SenX3
MGLLQRRRDGTHGDAADSADLLAELAQVRLELDRARTSLDNLPVGVVLVDAAGTVIMRNARSHQGTGHGEVLVQEAIERHVQAALRGRESHSSIELFGPPRRVIQVTATPLSDGGAIVAVDDISERARLDAVRTDFVANISHELKTPVGALAVLAEAIADEDDIEIVQRLAGKMVEEAHRAATAIDDLLELSRIELGGRAVRDPVDVGALMRDAVVRTLAAAEQRDIRIDLEEPVDKLTVLGDRRQLVSALGNLVDNAVKYSERGSDVWVSANVDEGVVALRVADTGIGIPTRDLDRIFERFYRVDRARSRDTGGTGLGLAIVRHVATNHDGEVVVQSSEGEGSTFTLRMPVAT